MEHVRICCLGCLFSMTLRDLGLIPGHYRPGKCELTIPWFSVTFQHRYKHCNPQNNIACNIYDRKRHNLTERHQAPPTTATGPIADCPLSRRCRQTPVWRRRSRRGWEHVGWNSWESCPPSDQSSETLQQQRSRTGVEFTAMLASVIFVNEKENKNVEKRENNEFVNENEKMMKTKTKLKRKNRKRLKTKTKESKTKMPK